MYTQINDIINNNNATKRDSIKELLGLVCDYFVIKNKDLEYVCVSNDYPTSVGFKDEDEIISTNPADINLKCDLADMGEQFTKESMDILSTGNPLHRVTFCLLAGGNPAIRLGYKKPIYDNKDITGVIAYGNDITNSSLAIPLLALKQTDSKIFGETATEQRNYHFFELKDDALFSNNEAICGFFLLRGKTAKEIARYMNCSYRTVEYFISEIKFKLGCTTKSQIVEKMINIGFDKIIPKDVLQYLV